MMCARVQCRLVAGKWDRNRGRDFTSQCLAQLCMFISLPLPSQPPSLSCLLQPLRHIGAHSLCEEKSFLPASICPATAPHPGACWVEIWLWATTQGTGLTGGNRTQVFLLERWQSRCFLIISVSYILSILC